MSIPESAVLRFTPKGLADAFDSTDTFPGACRKLQNLVFDQSNPELVIARPGVDGSITSFAGFTTPGFVSTQVTIGTRIYGMLSTGLTAGKDQPFCYDLSTSSFVTIVGVTAGNAEGRPNSQATSGAWTPPTLAAIGTYLVITHPGYSGSALAASFVGGTGGVSSLVLTVATMTTGVITPGMNVTGTGIPAGTCIASFGTGTGGVGTYYLNQNATVTTGATITGASAAKFGLLNLANSSSLIYSTTDLGKNALPSVPTAVANLNNRAYFACLNIAYYSDVIAPAIATNAGQALTMGDNSPINALSGLPVQTTSGGVISALLAFKTTQIWQVTGDAAVTGTLALNYLSLNIGSACPRSICPSPLGTFFVGPDAAYVVSPFGAVMPVTGDMGGPGSTPHLRQPFGYVTIPTRVAGAFAGNIYRICMPTIIDGTSGIYDYWFDTRKLRWNGPHTFNYDCASSAGNYFIVTGVGSGAKLFASNPFPITGTVYTDNGVAFNIDMVSADLQKHDEMAMKQVVESTIELSSVGPSATYGITVYDDQANYITSASITTAQSGGVWGANIWGDGSRWRGSRNQPYTYRINWPITLVFNKLAIEITCPAGPSISIGAFFARAQKTGYTLQQA